MIFFSRGEGLNIFLILGGLDFVTPKSAFYLAHLLLMPKKVALLEPDAFGVSLHAVKKLLFGLGEVALGREDFAGNIAAQAFQAGPMSF